MRQSSGAFLGRDAPQFNRLVLAVAASARFITGSAARTIFPFAVKNHMAVSDQSSFARGMVVTS